MLYKVWPGKDLKKLYMTKRILTKGHKKIVGREETPWRPWLQGSLHVKNCL